MVAIFLDRDGVINRNVYYYDTGAWESPRTQKDFQLSDMVLPALQKLQAAGFPLFLVSNQPNAAKQKSTIEELHAIHAKMLRNLKSSQIQFEECFYCFHHPNGIVTEYSGPCKCRKPNPYFLLKAAVKYNLDLSRSWMIGDRKSDIECGFRAGTRNILIDPSSQNGKKNSIRAHHTASNLFDALKFII